MFRKTSGLTWTKLTPRQMVLLATPPILWGTTYVAFKRLGERFGATRGYLGGFLFYWICWCLLLPLWIVGPRKLRDMFRESRPRLGKPAWLGVTLLGGPVIAPYAAVVASPAEAKEADLKTILYSAAFSLVNGTMEEVLWRGAYVALFPENWLWGYVYPSVGFGVWHLSPQVIFPYKGPGGAVGFATAAVFLGASWGWVAKQTRSIRWTALAHILNDFPGLAGRSFR
jgi:hypothetical protein